MIRRALLFAALTLFSASGASASSDDQLWSTTSINANLGGPWGVLEDFTARFSDNRKGLYELESSTLLSYRISKLVTVAGGYVHNPQYVDGGRTSTIEHRAREQVSFDKVVTFGPAKLSARLRAEQRWRDHVDGVGWRVRPYVKLAMPLVGKASLNLSNETFVNLNRTSYQRQRGVDRMRNLVSVSVPLSSKLSGEAGYLNQHGFVRGGHNSVDHVAYFALGFSL